MIPKWIFQKCTKRFFRTGINGNEQTYNKTTIPACADCNNNLLANIENYILSLFSGTDLNISFFSSSEIYNIIRWLEIIEYKFQILEIRRRFTKHKKSPFIPYLSDIPISIMRSSINYSPAKTVAEIRLSQKRLTINSKENNYNSLIIFKSKNKEFHFFHQMNDYIFLELPQYNIAIFYFYTKIFTKPKDAYNTSIDIIKTNYL